MWYSPAARGRPRAAGRGCGPAAPSGSFPGRAPVHLATAHALSAARARGRRRSRRTSFEVADPQGHGIHRVSGVDRCPWRLHVLAGPTLSVRRRSRRSSRSSRRRRGSAGGSRGLRARGRAQRPASTAGRPPATTARRASASRRRRRPRSARWSDWSPTGLAGQGRGEGGVEGLEHGRRGQLRLRSRRRRSCRPAR